jgi:sporulation protein YlmC with PRC-barrel domain
MKRKIKSLTGFTIGATDGIVGKVKEFYFDDKTWTIRYLIVETGNWLMSKKILVSSVALLTPDWENKIFPVNLTLQQIKDSPDINTDMPVSRQHEMDLYSYYSLGNYYWAGGMGMSDIGMSYPLSLNQEVHNETDASVADRKDEDHHLRSTEKVTGYRINATDGKIGDVEDFIIDDQTWEINFLVVDTGNWFPGKKVLISPKWIMEINWETALVVVTLSELQVKNSPKYIPRQEISNHFENSLQNYYERHNTAK